MQSSRQAIAAAAVLALAVASASCPDGEPEEPPPSAPQITRARVLSAILGYYERCLFPQYDFAELVEPGYFGLLSMDDFYRDYFTSMVDVIFDSPHVQINMAAMDECMRWYESAQVCVGDPPDACQEAWTGTLPEGSACAIPVECAPDLRCADQTETGCGVCTPPAGLGEPCQSVSCAEGLSCDHDTDVPICVELAELGQECDQRPCGDQLDCDHSQSPPLCAPLAGLGESCDHVGCQRELECDREQAESVCVVREPARSYRAGDDCTPARDGCGEWFSTGLYCDDPDADGAGSCAQITIAEEGEPCAYVQGGLMNPVCRNGIVTTHYCSADIMQGERTGTCQRRPAVGEPCDPVLGSCNTLEAYCDRANDLCVPIAAEGATCQHIETNYPCGALSTCDSETDTCVSFEDQLEWPGLPVCS